MSLEQWKSQLRKGAAEMAVLAVLEQGDAYGIAILDQVESGEGLGVSEGSLYPLLKRLEASGRIKSDWRESKEGGTPRKYYALTPEGSVALKAMRESWRAFRDQIDQIVG